MKTPAFWKLSRHSVEDKRSYKFTSLILASIFSSSRLKYKSRIIPVFDELEKQQHMQKYHRYLVLASFSENTLRTNFPFLWGWKVEGMMAYSPGGSLKRSHTSRVLMKVLLIATAFWRSNTSGPRRMLQRPLYLEEKVLFFFSSFLYTSLSLKWRRESWKTNQTQTWSGTCKAKWQMF